MSPAKPELVPTCRTTGRHNLYGDDILQVAPGKAVCLRCGATKAWDKKGNVTWRFYYKKESR